MTGPICFILPTYDETDSVHQLILELHKAVPNNSRIVIIDDSPSNKTLEYAKSALVECAWTPENTHFIKNSLKSGRGHAVKMGLEYALLDEMVECFVEMDSDGSHSSIMAMSVAREIPLYDFCVGSRYLKESKIVGWSLERRIFSRLINSILRQVFTSRVSDWTNGLRAYSRKAAKEICRHKSLTSGFIYLSEQAVILTNGDFLVGQVPITFLNRTHGESTVTWRELANSISGIILIFKNRKKLRTK